MAAWLGDEGLPPDSPRESQLRLLWRSFQAVRSRLSSVTSDLEAQRSKHLAEMAEVTTKKTLKRTTLTSGMRTLVAQVCFFLPAGTQIAGADPNFHGTQGCSGSGDSG